MLEQAIQNSFITWEMLASYPTFVAIVFMVVAFTKELKFLKNIPTQYYSATLAYIGLIMVDLHNVLTTEGMEFDYWNLILFALSAIAIAMFNGTLADKTGKRQ